MKKKLHQFSKRSVAMVLALILVVGIAFVVPSRAADTADLGKLVDYFQANSDQLTLNENSRFFLSAEPTGDLLQTVQLAQRQFAADGIPTSTPMNIVWGDTSLLRAGDIYIQLVSSDSNIGAEGYKITVTTYATVIAKDVRGLLYGLNQLQKHFRAADSNTIKGFTTYDTPDTKERVVSVDCARKYLTVDYVCNMVKEMSWMGYNTLQLHFSEDSGFRIDLWDPTYYIDYNGDGTKYQPANDFSWICGGEPTTWTHTSTLTGINYANYTDKAKYLTMAEVIRILETCKEYHIDVIPSFDTPAHLDYVNWKYEQNYKSNTNYSFYSTYDQKYYYAKDVSGCINYSQKTGYTKPQWPYYTTFNIAGAQANAFITELHIDIANFFSEFAGSNQFSICADECNMSYNTTWDYDDFIGYVKKLNTLLNGKGYTVRMYNDFIDASYLSQIPSNISILYWNSAYNSIDGTANAYDVISVANMVSNGRTLYNCINQHTYYVLRINDTYGDARSKTCYQWEFYGATEEAIWNDWTPNNIRKKGKYTEPDAIVPAAQLGGAYFLMWHDYAAVNTENEIWNGVTDSAKKTGEIYSLRERMWSNTMKMWNSDINSSLSFANFETIRDMLGDFPGLQDNTYPTTSSYAKATSLPASSNPIMLATTEELLEVINIEVDGTIYTSASYSAYLTAYNEAVAIISDSNATAEARGSAKIKLEKTIQGLKRETFNVLTIKRSTTINGTVHIIDTTKYNISSTQDTFNIFIPALTGYNFLKADGFAFTPSENGDGSGYLTGGISSDLNINISYENAVDVSQLNTMINEAITDPGDYTASSWRAYSNALNAAEQFSLTVTTQQTDVDALATALKNARNALVVESATTYISVENLAPSYNKGQLVGLYVQTSSNVPNLTITDSDGNTVTPNSITGEVQKMKNGEYLKYWVVFLPAEKIGTFTYTITYGAVSTSITVTVT